MSTTYTTISFTITVTPIPSLSVLQVSFSLVAGNMQDVFEIKTVNDTYGEVYVNTPLDRESVDRYLLKVRQRPAPCTSPPCLTARHMFVSMCALLLT